MRKNFKTTNSLVAFLDHNNAVVRDTETMLDLAVSHYKNLFSQSQVYRPHPYTDSPSVEWDNYNEKIPPITMPELLKVVSKVKKKTFTRCSWNIFIYVAIPPEQLLEISS